MVKYISRYGRYLTKICQNYGQDGAFQKCDKKSLGIKWKSMSTLTICHWHWDKMSANQSDQTLRAQSGSRPFAVKGRSSSFHPFFQDCVRGQHLCLAHAERSSSFHHFFRTAWEGNTSAWLMRRGRLHTLKQTNIEVSCDFFWHWTQTVIDCIVEN